MAQPVLIKGLKAPLKIFGGLHGNYTDLMRFFDIWKEPSE
jgi:protein phosphatase